jgi:hypothetical protein
VLEDQFDAAFEIQDAIIERVPVVIPQVPEHARGIVEGLAKKPWRFWDGRINECNSIDRVQVVERPWDLDVMCGAVLKDCLT